MKLSIVIPCFNEAENVCIVLERFKEILKSDMEVIVIDGGSTDGTPKALSQAFETLDKDRFKLILSPERGGYGKDIMTALLTAKGDVLSWTHADLQTDPSDVLKAYELFLQQKTPVFVKGKRKNRRLSEAFFTFGMQVVVCFVLGTYLDDINAQPKMFSRKFFEEHMKNGAPNDFSLDLFAMYRAKKAGHKIISFPVYFSKRLHGEAKGGGGSWKNRINLIKRTFKYIVALKKKL